MGRPDAVLIDVADLSVRAQPEETWDLAQVVVHHDGPPEVRRWLRGPAKMRIIGSAYHPASDADYAITVGGRPSST